MADSFEHEIAKAVSEATQCKVCANFIDAGSESVHPTCKAFSSGIPAEIWVGNHKHTVNYPGDHGIKYIPLTVR
jgi:hypothetical protein